MDDRRETSGEPEVSVRFHFVFGIFLVVLGMLASFLLHLFPLSSPIVQSLENTVIDVFFLVSGGTQSKDVVIVEINDDDYGSLFDRVSPLKQPVVRDLIEAIAFSGAHVVGIDLDTSAWKTSYDAGKAFEACAAQVPPLDCDPQLRFVWALNGDVNKPPGPTIAKELAGTGTRDCQAVPALLVDRDGIVRRYLDAVSTNTGDVKRSMGTAVAHGCKELSTETSDHEDRKPRWINFSQGTAGFLHLDATTVLQASKVPGWRANNPLRTARFVLLGGTYPEARDTYVTPLGNLNGVDVLAFTVRGELGHLEEYAYPPLELMLGVFLLWITWRTRHHRILSWLAPWLAIPFLAVISYAVLVGFGYFASFVSVAVGVVFEHLFEFYYKHNKLQEDHQALQRDYRRLLADRATTPDSGTVEYVALRVDIES